MDAAVVGCGRIAVPHLKHLRRLRGVRIVGVCDRASSAAARAAALAGGCPAYTELAHLLADARPDVLHVLTPPATHRPLVLEALEAGCHVLVEKPMGLSTAECDEMAAAARAAGRQLCVAHHFLFERGVRRALESVSRGTLGRVTSVDLFWRVDRHGPEGNAPPWIRELPGGVFQEVAPHPVYLLDAFLQEARVVAAMAAETGATPPGEPDELRILFDSAGAVGSVSVSVGSWPRLITLVIRGTRKSLEVDLTTNVTVVLREFGARGTAKAVGALDRSGQRVAGTAVSAARAVMGRLFVGRDVLITRFYRALRAGAPPPVTPEEGRRAVALLDEVWARMDGKGRRRPGRREAG